MAPETRRSGAPSTISLLHELTTRLHSTIDKHRRPGGARKQVDSHKANLSPEPRKPSIQLHPPQEIASKLINCGYPEDIAQTVSATFLDVAFRIRADCERVFNGQYTEWSIRQTSKPKRTSPLLIVQNIQQLYVEELHRAENIAFNKARTLLASVDENAEEHTQNRPSFNQRFVPILEEYFEQNAYPNGSHRIFLAKQSGMTTRQIAVWFQNHRSRAKKEHRDLKRNPDIRLNVIFNDERVSPSPQPERSEPEYESDTTSEEEEESESEGPPQSTSHPDDHTNFRDTSPPHAFPSPYLLAKDRPNPSHEEENAQTIDTPWYRRPAKPRPPKSFKRVHEGEIEDLCISLATLQARYLNKHGKPSKQRKRKRRWDVHLRTIVETAPLPSSVPNPNPGPVHPIEILQTKRAPISQVKNAFTSYQESPFTLIPPTVARQSGPTNGRRPSRSTDRAPTPTRSCASSRASTPSSSSSIGSPLFSPAPPSRRRRLEADSSSSSSDEPSRKRRRTSLSSSSSSSSLSSAITTPLLGPRELSNAGKPSIASPQSEFDFISLDDQISRPPPLTWAEAFHFGFQPPTMTAKDMSFTLDLSDSSWQTQPSVYVPP